LSQQRYPELSECWTKLDPLEDVTAWFRGLRSHDFTTDLLRTKHGFVSSEKTRDCGKAISAHAESAVELLEQAFSGSPRISYLSLYYAMLDLAKVVILCKGRLSDLRAHRSHGLAWTGISRVSQDLLTDHITLQEHGAFGLFYDCLAGQMWPKTAQKDKSGDWISTYKRQILLRDVYPYIRSIGFEYTNTYGEASRFEHVQIDIDETRPGAWRAVVQFPGAIDVGRTINRKRFKILSGLSTDGSAYVTRTVSAADRETARNLLAHDLRWFLLSPSVVSGRSYTLTPYSSSSFLMPEEIPTLLAFFHLGSVVRYDPERLSRLFDSRACGMLETLRRHGTYDYLLATWSFVTQTQVAVHR
jgi:hypothetical protein